MSYHKVCSRLVPGLFRKLSASMVEVTEGKGGMRLDMDPSMTISLLLLSWTSQCLLKEVVATHGSSASG
jgi:hypothetical protein